MHIMFSDGIRKLDLSRVAPYDDNDLMYFIDENIGIRLANIITADQIKFSISTYVDNEPAFGKSESKESLNFKRRFDDFTMNMSVDIERFFITKKTRYLFFDDREQKLIADTFLKFDLSCAVEIYVNSVEGFKRIDISDIPFKRAASLIPILERLKVRETMTIDAYYKLLMENRKVKGDTRFMSIEDIMVRYPKMETITTKQEFRKYERGLKKKYHPDTSLCSDAHEIFIQINEDFELVAKSSWYRSLKDIGGETSE